jgi:hypothetical protein
MENTFGAFTIGVLVGIILTVVLTISALSTNKKSISSSKKITPEWKLVTDGKVVDTLYIYKQK